MPFAIHRTQKIHYTITGTGPAVIFQHGLFSSAASWKINGFVDALSKSHTVICVDSLGHGKSDKPANAALYELPQRAAHVLAVADDAGADRFHLVGYSMGGWIASGVAQRYPERLDSLVVGGWDVVDGTARVDAILQETTGAGFGFDSLITGARELAPELVEWVTPEVEPGLRACCEALSDLDGLAEAVATLPAPVMLWCGVEDPVHDAMQSWTGKNALGFLSVRGDHVTALYQYAKESSAGLADFLARTGSAR